MSDKLSEANSVKCEAQVCIGMRIMNTLINFLHDAFLFMVNIIIHNV